jgi:hypothetical protein
MPSKCLLLILSSDFSKYQQHRHNFIPRSPATLANIETTKLVVSEEEFPIKKELDPIFPSLLGKGMKYLELKRDDSGKILKSDKPLKVRALR